MSRRKIAPALQRWCSEEPMTVDALPEVQAELRALLAVARAAERDLDRLAESIGVPRAAFDEAEDTTGKLARALRRLRPSPAKPGARDKG